MAERIWCKSYPPGVPYEIDMSEFSSINDILARSCRRFHDRPAFTNLGATLRYNDLDRLTRDFAAFLQSLPDLKRNERVAIMMPNLLQYPIALFGVLRAGMIVVNVNPLYTARELEYQLKDSGARVIVVVENFAHTLQDVIGNTELAHVITTQIGDMAPTPKRWIVNYIVKHVKKMVPAWTIPGTLDFRQCLRQGAAAPLKEEELSHDDVAFLQYTGGTTGIAKGAILSHGNVIANLQQASAWFRQALEESKEVVITPLPLYHIFALTANCLVFMKLGGKNVLITNPRDLGGFVAELRKHRFSVITGVNTLYNALLNTLGFADLDFSGLKLAVGGATAIQRAVAERWQQATGCRLTEAYGLTEASPGVCINPINADYNGSIGLPLPSTEVSIRDDEGSELPIGSVGELCVRGPQVMKGYWRRPQDTAAVLSSDGWLRTGDLGIMDEHGYVRITDRKKDLILVSGFNVYPNEVEGVMAMHPGVLESAAVAVPDTKTGEAVKVFIVKKDPALTAEDVIGHCRSHLAAYKVPKQVEFRAELSKTPVGKILRRELRSAA